MSFFRFLLLPFAILYGGITALRNFLYDTGILKSHSFDIPVIGIGNLSTGGTGKTPMAEYVIQLLLDAGYKPALLSRGYGRKTKGYILANNSTDAGQIGDEPYQVFRKFSTITVAVCEDRLEGIKNIQRDRNNVNVIVLDDCFQHRRLHAGFYILLTDYNNPYYRDFLLPAGNLREGIAGRKRANIVLMTKCPYVDTDLPRANLIARLKPLHQQQVFFTGMKYFAAISASNNENLSELRAYSILAFSGIAHPETFISFIKNNSFTYKNISFGDHHDYTEKDIENIALEFDKLQGPKIILTTEKDWRRLENKLPASYDKNLKSLDRRTIYYLPVGMRWDAMEKRNFDLKILDNVRKNTTER